MVVATEKDAVIDIRLADIPSPMKNVMRLAQTRRTIAIAQHAPAVSGREGLTLAGVVEPLLAPDIQWPPIR